MAKEVKPAIETGSAGVQKQAKQLHDANDEVGKTELIKRLTTDLYASYEGYSPHGATSES
ncbi:MAG: hypothetical protein MZU84_02935 [Sphingobacterium sp.]|nr:hypothetical protein [Sphingobacterium sp.]